MRKDNMRAALVCLIAAGMLAFGASEALSKPLGTRTEGQVLLACLNTEGGRVTSGSGPGGFGCKTDKGEVSCKKTGTLNDGAVGSCEGCNPSCSADLGGGTTGGRTLDDILSPPTKARQLEPLEASGDTNKPPARTATQSPGGAPMHQMTPQ
jgi:hypothetical protein